MKIRLILKLDRVSVPFGEPARGKKATIVYFTCTYKIRWPAVKFSLGDNMEPMMTPRSFEAESSIDWTWWSGNHARLRDGSVCNEIRVLVRRPSVRQKDQYLRSVRWEAYSMPTNE